MKKIRIGFDIGGVISKYPEEMKLLMRQLGPEVFDVFEVYVVTDMPRDQAEAMLKDNKIDYDPARLLCGDWTKHGDECKQVLMAENKIDIMIDDRMDYITNGPAIGLLVMPRPKVGYYAAGWKFPDLKQQRLEQLAEELGYELVKKQRLGDKPKP